MNSDYLRRDYVEEKANGGRWKYSAGFGASAFTFVQRPVGLLTSSSAIKCVFALCTTGERALVGRWGEALRAVALNGITMEGVCEAGFGQH